MHGTFAQRSFPYRVKAGVDGDLMRPHDPGEPYEHCGAAGCALGDAVLDVLAAVAVLAALPQLDVESFEWSASSQPPASRRSSVRAAGTAQGSVDSLPVRIRPRWKDQHRARAPSLRSSVAT
jgi:hypothetical protein